MAATQGRREVTMGEIKCPRCKREFHTRFDSMRFRSGSFYDAEREESFDRLCEDCHRTVVKRE
jgi:phage terminase large subunit GpA-like protein